MQETAGDASGDADFEEKPGMSLSEMWLALREHAKLPIRAPLLMGAAAAGITGLMVLKQ